MKDGDRRSIPWVEVKKRLRDSQLALENALVANPERTAAVYRERAAQLAARGSGVEAASSASRVLVFVLGTERFALDFGDVVEVLPFANCTPVPGAPPELLGVMNIHGVIRSVMDLARLLGLSDGTDRPAKGYVLLVRHQARQVGWRADSIDKILSLPSSELAAPEGDVTGQALRYLRGLTRDRLRLLNTEALFAHPVFTAGSR
jgi:purine-binding chemotaxis protein CheW